MYLLDTNVIFELRRPKPHGAVIKWIHSVDNAHLYICAVSLGEIQAGIELTRGQDLDKASELDAWLEGLTSSYDVLAMDGKAFRCWARFMHGKSKALYEDAMIAAIASINNLTVATRNTKDFKTFGVKTFNPFQ